MPKNSISEYSATAASNTDVGGVNIAEGFAPNLINNSIREVMSHLADAYAGDAAWDSVTDTITSGSTQTQAGATELTTIVNRVTVSGTDGDGVKLPTAVAGLECVVINDDAAQTIQVWPNTSDAIDGGSADAVDANALKAGEARVYRATDATNWYTVGTVGSAVTPAAATRAITAADSQVAADNRKTILASAASADYSYTLLAAATAGDGFEVTVKKTDATPYMITLTPNGSETIDGLPNLKLRNLKSAATLVSDGSNWHIAAHNNVAIEYNAIENANFLVDQYDHITRTGIQSSTTQVQDRWQQANGASPPAIWTYSNESAGGVDGKSKWGKFLCTTGGAPDATDHQTIRQSIIGNNGVGTGFLGSDGLFENAVLSFDVIGHLDTPAAPYTLALGVKTLDGTARQYIGEVTIDADATWQRVSLVIPEDATADIDPGTGANWHIAIGLQGGSSRQATANTWENNVTNVGNTSGSQNWGATANNYLGITNVKLQPGQIATPFVPRTYEEELDICQFYFEKLAYDQVADEWIAIATADTTAIATSMINYKRTKRAKPAITLTAAGTFAVLGSTQSTVSASLVGNEAFALVYTASGTPFTQYDAVPLRRDGSDTTYILVNSEI